MSPRRSLLTLLAAWLLALPATAGELVTPCAVAPFKPAHFPVSESLEFAVDVLGAQVGTLSLDATRGRDEGRGLTVRAHVKTGTFAANFRKIDGRAEAKLDSALKTLRYHEVNEENGVRRTVEMNFPAAGGGSTVDVRATKDGNPDQLELAAPLDARDYVSAIYAARGADLAMGRDICFDVYGGFRMWRVEGRVAEKERVRSPAGEFPSLRIDGTAHRLDDPNVSMEIHFWISDDSRRLPVAAFSSSHGKPMRALLTRVTSR